MLDYQDRWIVLIKRFIQRGMTLIEFMIGIAIVGILIAVAAPNFMNWIQSAQVRTAADSIVNGLQLARAEAVRLNTNVRFSLTDATGLVDWEICSVAVTPCPAANLIQQRPNTEGSINARVGVYEIGDGQPQTNYAVVAAAGNEMPTHVTFNGLGRTISDGADDTVRIDVTNAISATARRLVIVVSNPGGMIRMCDPALTISNPTDPKAC